MDLKTGVRYDLWANKLVRDAIIQAKDAAEYPEMERLFAHIFEVQETWVSRINAETSLLNSWPALKENKVEKAITENHKKLVELVPRTNKIITYTNSKGVEFSNSVEEILTHLIIHGQHHRAQIAMLLRKAGQIPPSTDYIFFLRSFNN